MRTITRLVLAGLLISALLIAVGVGPAQANSKPDYHYQDSVTEYPTLIAENPTAIPENPTDRPVIVASYSFVKKEKILPGSDFTLKLNLANQGNTPAYNILATIQGDKLIPRENGGVQLINSLEPGTDLTLRQSMYVTPELEGQPTATLNVSVAYSDIDGLTYSTTLMLLIDLTKVPPTSVYSGPILPTKTSTPAPRSKLIIGSYQSNPEKLQSGNLFKLSMNIKNLGNSPARNVTMVLGGATISADGTPSSGGISGGGGDLSKFAPLGSSNLYYLGDIPSGKTVDQIIPLVVNVSTEPGVYTLKISFVYEDTSGVKLLDDQVITLLVYALPQVSVSFYEDVPELTVGVSSKLPIQITNIGKKSTMLGDLSISTENGLLNKNKATIGNIDTGGYFTLDAEYIPEKPGPVTLNIQIDYTDDFQQPGKIEKSLTVKVVEAPVIITPPLNGGPNGGETPIPVEDSTWDKIVKAVFGFFGFSGG